jgi:hypothetical protein
MSTSGREDTSSLGFRQLNASNWLDIDPLMKTTIISPFGSNPHDAWFEAISEFQLDDTVPVEVLRLFEAAKGILLYGLFFYPLIALGADQLVRVAEAAVRLKCRALGAEPRQFKFFSNAVGWLIKRDGIRPEHQASWTMTVTLRNDVSHLSEQRAYSVGMLLQQMHMLTAMINDLFSNSETPSTQPVNQSS